MKYIAMLIACAIILAPCSRARAEAKPKAEKIVVVVKVPDDQQNNERD